MKNEHDPKNATNENCTFDEWLKLLDSAAASFGHHGMVKQTGGECWRDYYNDGYTPGDAFKEDCSYA